MYLVVGVRKPFVFALGIFGIVAVEIELLVTAHFGHRVLVIFNVMILNTERKV
jgi:hypothetical protein